MLLVRLNVQVDPENDDATNEIDPAIGITVDGN